MIVLDAQMFAGNAYHSVGTIMLSAQLPTFNATDYLNNLLCLFKLPPSQTHGQESNSGWQHLRDDPVSRAIQTVCQTAPFVFPPRSMTHCGVIACSAICAVAWFAVWNVGLFCWRSYFLGSNKHEITIFKWFSRAIIRVEVTNMYTVFKQFNTVNCSLRDLFNYEDRPDPVVF